MLMLVASLSSLLFSFALKRFAAAIISQDLSMILLVNRRRIYSMPHSSAIEFCRSRQARICGHPTEGFILPRLFNKIIFKREAENLQMTKKDEQKIRRI